MEKSIYKLHEDLVLLKTEIDRLHQKSKHPGIINHIFKIEKLQSISNLIDLQREQIKELKEENKVPGHSDSGYNKAIEKGENPYATAAVFFSGSIGKMFIAWADDYFAIMKHPWPRVERSILYNEYRTHLKDSGVDLSKPSDRITISDFVYSLQYWCCLRNCLFNAHIKEDYRYPYPIDKEAGKEYITITTPYDHVETK